MPAFRHFLRPTHCFATAGCLLFSCLATALRAEPLTTVIRPDPWPNVAPFAETRTFDVERDRPQRTPSAILNVYDVENDPLTVSSFTQPEHGRAAANGDGTFLYTPARGFLGADAFRVTVDDGRGGSCVVTMAARVVAPAAGWAATRFKNARPLTPEMDFGAKATTMPRAIDWDRDGDPDVLVGAMGKVWLYRNSGTPNAPAFDAATQVQAGGGNIAAGTGRVTLAWTDCDGDGVPDLAVGNGGDNTIAFYRTISATGPVALAAGVALRNAADTADFIAADWRTDVADWNGDGKPDVITGTSSGPVKVAYHLGNPAKPLIGEPVEALDRAGATVNGSYNGSPRAIDLSRDGTPDLLVSWNWGNTDFRANLGSAASPLLGPTGKIEVALPDGTKPDLHALTDGPLVDLADFTGDGTLDLLFGGHIGGRVWLAEGVSIENDLAGIAATVAAHPSDLGAFLEGNPLEKERLKQRLGGVYDFLTTLATPSQVDRIVDQLEALIAAHPRYFEAKTLPVKDQPRIPSLAAMLHLTMLQARPLDPAHRARTAGAAKMTGAYRKLCTDIGLLYLENYLNPDAAEAIWQWVRQMPRDIYPGTGITQQESLDTKEYLVRGHLKNTFAGSAAEKGEFGFGADARSVLGDRGSENFLMTVVHHEATHDLDAYVKNHLPPAFMRRWGQVLVRAGGRDETGVNFLKSAPETGWYSQDRTQAHFREKGWWDGHSDWRAALEKFYNFGPGNTWKNPGFMRGSITFFLASPQESLATQGNQFWNSSEGRIEVALDRWKRGFDTNLTEVLLFMDIQSKGADKMKFWENTDANEQTITWAGLRRNEHGFIDSVEVGGRSYRFTVDSQGVVTAVNP